MKTLLYLLGGLGLMFLISTAGCGGISTDGLEQIDAGPLSSGTAGADAGPLHEHVGIDGGAGTGVVVVVTRPLGAGCTADTQCGSGICVKTGTSGMCCDGTPDTCNTCVGGYITPVSDTTGCDAKTDQICDGTDRKHHECMSGVCKLIVVHCAAATCDKDGKQLGCTTAGACAGEDDPCYCYIHDSGTISYPCPGS